MNTCKTCRLWLDQWTGKPPAADAEQGQCTHEMVGHSEEYPPRDGVRPSAAEGRAGDISTGPDFGCIHWEKIVADGDKCRKCGRDIGCIAISRGAIPRMEAAGIPWEERDGHIRPLFCSVCEILAYGRRESLDTTACQRQ